MAKPSESEQVRRAKSPFFVAFFLLGAIFCFYKSKALMRPFNEVVNLPIETETSGQALNTSFHVRNEFQYELSFSFAPDANAEVRRRLRKGNFGRDLQRLNLEWTLSENGKTINQGRVQSTNEWVDNVDGRFRTRLGVFDGNPDAAYVFAVIATSPLNKSVVSTPEFRIAPSRLEREDVVVASAQYLLCGAFCSVAAVILGVKLILSMRRPRNSERATADPMNE